MSVLVLMSTVGGIHSVRILFLIPETNVGPYYTVA